MHSRYTQALTIFLLGVITPVMTAIATDQDILHLHSGEQRVPLIELYTSEGCSSCPPADRWISKRKNDPELWTAYTPLGFHVDYWDHLGWEDRFADAQYSARQRRLAAGQSVVYTPGMFRDGREWRDWRQGDDPSLRNAPPAGQLTARIDGQSVVVAFAPVTAPGDELTAHVAVLGMSLETDVVAGENRGRTLQHDFVVLATTEAMLKQADDNSWQTTLGLPATNRFGGERAIAVWVSPAGRPEALQSVGGYLPAAVTVSDTSLP